MLPLVSNGAVKPLKKLVIGVAAALFALVAVGGILYATNTAPVVPALPADVAARAGRPYVVKIHAQWCPKCMMTKGVWSEIEEAYRDRVNLVVFDFTDEETLAATEAEARRIGLGDFFEWSGGTGSIQVLDGATKEVRATITGSRDLSEYTTAIDAALQSATHPQTR